jgi:hypothetical protein
MKTKIAIVLLAAITLLSFTLSSSPEKTVKENSVQELKVGKGGFELQDQDQF